MPAASSGPFAPLWGQDRSEHFLPWYQQDSAHLDRTSAGADIASIMSQKHQKNLNGWRCQLSGSGLRLQGLSLLPAEAQLGDLSALS